MAGKNCNMTQREVKAGKIKEQSMSRKIQILVKRRPKEHPDSSIYTLLWSFRILRYNYLITHVTYSSRFRNMDK